MPKSTIKIGERFCRLEVIEKTEKRCAGFVVFRCKCDCGNITDVTSRNIRSGHTKSCGCYSKERSKTCSDKDFQRIEHASLTQARSNKARSDSSVGIRGVSRSGNYYVARLGFNGKNYYLGKYKNLEDAVLARKKAEDDIRKPELERLTKEFEKLRGCDSDS